MNITHIINLFRAYFIENKKRLLICCLVTFGALVFGFTVSEVPEVTPFFPYIVLFFLVAFGNSNLINNNSTHFNNLPATTGEKFIHAIISILILGIGFYLLALAGAYAGHYLILPLLREDICTHGFSFWDFTNMTWKGYLIYSTFLVIFLFGSIYFKKNGFLKTIGVGIGFSFGLTLYATALLYIAFGTTKDRGDSININLADNPFFETYWYIFPIAIIIFFLSLTYLRLRETEV